MIFSEDGEEMGDRTKPVSLDGMLKLYCRSRDGDPLPSLSWRRGGVPIPAAGQSRPAHRSGQSGTVLLLPLSERKQCEH